jgi:hypothetical protein
VDPDKALEEIRSLIAYDGRLGVVEVERLVELVGGLDTWIDSGGFLPKAWGGDPAFPESDERGLSKGVKARILGATG